MFYENELQYVYNTITILFLGKIKGSFYKNVLENDKDPAPCCIHFFLKWKIHAAGVIPLDTPTRCIGPGVST